MYWSFPDSSVGKESAYHTEGPGSMPGSGRSPGEGKGYPLQYSGLENPMDCIVYGVAKSQTQRNNFYFHFFMENSRHSRDSCNNPTYMHYAASTVSCIQPFLVQLHFSYPLPAHPPLALPHILKIRSYELSQKFLVSVYMCISNIFLCMV